MTTATAQYIIKGTNEDEDTCSHCGRTNLKRVTWLAVLDADGNEQQVAHYGVDCAARLISASTGESTTGKHVHNVARSIAYAEKWIAHYGRTDKALGAIASQIGVKFNVWAWAEDSTVQIKTAAGMVAV